MPAVRGGAASCSNTFRGNVHSQLLLLWASSFEGKLASHVSMYESTDSDIKPPPNYWRGTITINCRGPPLQTRFPAKSHSVHAKHASCFVPS